MDWLSTKYINLVSSRFSNFKRKGPELYNMSCHLCGDSHKDKFRARGYLYSKKGSTFYFCHNCSISLSFDRFLKSIDEAIYFDFILERRMENRDLNFRPQSEPPKPEVVIPTGIFSSLKSIAKLRDEHPAKMYVASRKIPEEFYHSLYYAPKYSHWVNSIIPDKLDEKYEEPRLVIPFKDFDQVCFGFQGRDFRKQKTPTRYLTIIFDKGRPNFYGLDRLDLKERIYCFEGPIDSMFIPNSVASFGGIIHRDVREADLPMSLITVVYDNERHSKETVQKMHRALMNEFSVCIWPDSISQKDVNDMVLAKVKDIKHIIDINTFSGFEGIARLNEWKRTN